MPGTMETSGELNWLLDELVSQVPQVRHTVVLSGDGLPAGASAGLSRDDKERFAAIASGSTSETWTTSGPGTTIDALWRTVMSAATSARWTTADPSTEPRIL